MHSTSTLHEYTEIAPTSSMSIAPPRMPACWKAYGMDNVPPPTMDATSENTAALMDDSGTCDNGLMTVAHAGESNK